MQIIQPAHNKPAIKVNNWKEISEEAEELRQFISARNFKGLYDKAFAISHAQVSETPKAFFVVSENTERYDLVKMFGHWCIINLFISEHGEEIDFTEACMSFPHREPKRTRRYNEVEVTYWIPWIFGLRKMKRTFSGLPAFICQHEEDHAHGRNIYFHE